jgi:transcriptional regulator with XRE-family HTH domain
VRQHLDLRQVDVGNRAGVSQKVVSDLELGRLEAVGLARTRRVAAVLDVSIGIDAWWRGGQADRLLDRAHAGLVDYVVGVLGASGWQVVPEFTFNHYGDRGSVDILAWHPGECILLIVEVKATLTDLQDMLGSLSKKVRVVPKIAAGELGWVSREPVGRLASRCHLRGGVPGALAGDPGVASPAPWRDLGDLAHLCQCSGHW